jgi:glycosyltransferase involved in cell wall biosynthesis
LSLAAALVILRQRPEVVHVHGTYWWSILPVLTARLIGASSVLKSTRDGEDDARTVFTKRWGPLKIGWLYGIALRRTDAVIVLNEHARQSAVAAGLASTTRLIRNGVNVEALKRTAERRSQARAAEQLSPTDQVVLFVGYLAKHKGVQDLIDVWRARGDKATQLWLIGPMTGFYRELDDHIPQEIGRLRDDGFTVRHLGHIPVDDMPHYYWAADVFVLPSYAEGMPNSLAEAIVSGCEIVATTIPGITEILEPHEAAFFAPGDLVHFENALAQSLTGDRHDCRLAASKLNIETVADRYESLYQQIGQSS